MPLDLSPEPIRLRMPDECKRFVVPKWTTHTLIALPAAALALLVFIAEVLKALSITITHVLPIPLGFASWLWAV